MALLSFQRPEKVLMLEASNTYGKFEFRPLEPGYGITIGNSLRRILLSSLEGFAVSSIKIDGINHEFASIPGVVEDVTRIIMNLKRVRFKRILDDIDIEKITINVSGIEEFKAGEIGKHLKGFAVLNKDLIICRLNKDASFSIDITVERGHGYVTAEENRKEDDAVNQIPIDAVFTPIRHVKYTIENFRVEQKTDYEKLVLEISTDGSILPKDALKESAGILIHHFEQFSDEKIHIEPGCIKTDEEEFDEDFLHMRQMLKTRLADMSLSVRALNCLKAANVETLGDLLKYQKTDLMKFRNFGKKSLTELDELFKVLRIDFGMDVSIYKLDKD
jgi:DNA-directed RNA polymerase subunit alpha